MLNKHKVAAAIGVAATLISLPFWVGLFPSPINRGSAGAALPVAQKMPLVAGVALKTPSVKYGFVLDSFAVIEGKISQNQPFADLLSDNGLTDEQIAALRKKAESIFPFSKAQTGKEYLLLGERTKAHKPEFLVYSPNVYKYIVFDLRDNMRVYEVRRAAETRLEVAVCEIKKSLWESIDDLGLDDDIADKMQDAFKYAVDIQHIGKGDRFKVVYERNYVDGKPVEVGDLKAALLEENSSGETYEAFKYHSGDFDGYFDAEGRPQRLGFLASPVKVARISSNFSMNRMHPILGYARPHLGTDYAAPIGTPILAVADGVVSKAESAGGNGNFVKLKHSGTYETQYLHMSKFAKGIRPGAKVAQGDVIGYVGSSGLSTGPHCCFRFWKNGQQVNHLKEKLPHSEPISKGQFGKFSTRRDELVTLLNAKSFEGTADRVKVAERHP